MMANNILPGYIIHGGAERRLFYLPLDFDKTLYIICRKIIKHGMEKMSKKIKTKNISAVIISAAAVLFALNSTSINAQNKMAVSDTAKADTTAIPVVQPPMIDSFTVLPESALTTTNISCTVTKTTDFQDKPVNVIYSWLVDSKPFAALYLPFDTQTKAGSDIVKDYSGNNRDCKLGLSAPYCKPGENYPAWVNDGKIGGAVRFDGNGLPGMQNKCLNDYIQVDDTTMDFTKQFTFAMWYKASGFPGEFNFLVSKEGTVLLRFHPQYDYCLHGYVTSAIQLENIASTKCIFSEAEIGKWHHLAFTYDGKQLALYIDGEVDATKPYDKVLDTHESFFHIGAHGAVVPAYDGTYGINGTLDEFYAFEIGVSAEQIHELYLEGMPGHSGSTIVRQQLSPGQTWTCRMIPNDSFQDGPAREAIIPVGR